MPSFLKGVIPMANKLDLAKLWPYSWEYGNLVEHPGGGKYPIDICEIMFVTDLRGGKILAGCTLPNKEDVYAAWNAMTEQEQEAAVAELYRMDNTVYETKSQGEDKAPKIKSYYNEMCKLYNGGKFNIAECEALVDQYRAQIAEENKTDAAAEA